MGTRGLWGFRNDGCYKVTYNHFGSFPECLGSKVVDFIKYTPVVQLNQIYNKIIIVNRDSTANQEQIDECKEFADVGVDDGRLDNWYVLLRKTQGLPFLYRDTDLRYMVASLIHMYDPIMCEYAYIINLNKEVLEICIPVSNVVTPVMNIKFETIKQQHVDEVVGRMETFLRMRYSGQPV